MSGKLLDLTSWMWRSRGLWVSLSLLSELGNADLRWQRVSSRTDQHLATEVGIAVHALNRMLDLGRPSYVRIVWSWTGLRSVRPVASFQHYDRSGGTDSLYRQRSLSLEVCVS